MRLAYLLTALLTAVLPALAAKPPKVQWTKTFAGWGNAQGYCVQQTSDGGYIAVGTTSSADSTPTYAVLLVKLYASGDTQWVRTFKAAGGMMGSSVVQTSDGGYIVAGGAGAADRGHWDPCLLRISASGNELWRSLLANLFSAQACSVVRLGDTAYTVVAQRYYGDNAVILWRTGSMGDLRWTHAYNIFYGYDDPNELALCRTSDGGYIVGTKTLLKVDSLGAQPQLKTYSSLGNASSVVQTSDGGYAATGMTSDYSSIYLLKTNANLDIVWGKLYSPSEWSRGQWVEQTTNGGYIICGTTRPGNGDDKLTLVRTSSNGDTVWTDTPFYGDGYCVRQTADEGYVVTGESGGLFVTKFAAEGKR
jgi:hypothetical protein